MTHRAQTTMPHRYPRFATVGLLVVALLSLCSCRLFGRTDREAKALYEACGKSEAVGDLELAKTQCEKALRAGSIDIETQKAIAERLERILVALRAERIARGLGPTPGCACQVGDPLCSCFGPQPSAVATVPAGVPVPPDLRHLVVTQPGPSLFEQPLPAVAALATKLGPAPVRALELVVYPGWLRLQAQDPNKRENVDEFEFRVGAVSDPKPVRLHGRSEKHLEEHLFALSEVDFTRVPALVTDARKRLAIEDGEVSHAILKRDIPFGTHVRWRVYVNGPRKSGSVEYDAKGAFRREFR